MYRSKWLRAALSCVLAAMAAVPGARAQVFESPVIPEASVTARTSYLSGQVLADCDANAATLGDRAPLPGVTVLLRKGMRTVATTSTNGLGQYRFARIPADVYDVIVVPPPGGDVIVCHAAQ